MSVRSFSFTTASAICSVSLAVLTDCDRVREGDRQEDKIDKIDK